MWCTAAPPYDEGMHWVDCTDEQHGEAILAIFNEAIVHSTALYDYEPRTRAQMTSWFEAKRAGGFPVIGLESDAGELMGFASYGTFRAWPAYKYTVEHSDRDALALHLKDQGVPTAVYYPIPLHLQPAYEHYPRGAGGLPVTERLKDVVISLPMHPYLSEKDQDTIVQAVVEAVA